MAQTDFTGIDFAQVAVTQSLVKLCAACGGPLESPGYTLCNCCWNRGYPDTANTEPHTFDETCYPAEYFA